MTRFTYPTQSKDGHGSKKITMKKQRRQSSPWASLGQSLAVGTLCPCANHCTSLL